jgi:anaerobic selenocysteine-containing dehydrogenase
MSFGNEGITTYGLSIGYQEPYAQYQPRLIEPPDDSEVLADWRIFYELARRMGLKLAYRGQPFDMENAPTTEELLEHFVRRSRVPLDLIKQHPHGHLYPDPQPLAESRDADWPHRLQLGDATMLGQLQQVSGRLNPTVAIAGAGASRPAAGPAADGAIELLLVSRREHAVYNSVAHHLPALRRRRPFNPAYVNPADARRLNLEDGGAIEIESSVGRVNAVLQLAPDVREGVVSMAHGFDPLAGERQSACTAALVDDENDYEPLSGLPRMSAIPVRLRRRAAV